MKLIHFMSISCNKNSRMLKPTTVEMEKLSQITCITLYAYDLFYHFQNSIILK